MNFVFERAVPFSYRVIYTFPVYCHCRRYSSSVYILWMLGRCWVFSPHCTLLCYVFFSPLLCSAVVFFHTFIRSFVRLKFCSLYFFPHRVLLHSFVFRCWCYFFFRPFRFILFSSRFFCFFPSLRSLLWNWMWVCFVRSYALYSVRFFFISTLLSSEHSICFSCFSLLLFFVVFWYAVCLWLGLSGSYTAYIQRRYFRRKITLFVYIVSDFVRTSNTKLLFVFIIMKHRKTNGAKRKICH